MLVHAIYKAIEDGDVFECKLFTAAEIKDLSRVWKVQLGTIRDPGPKFGIEIVRFTKREAENA